MIIEVLMPALSPTMTEGNLAKWLKKEGDKIAPGDVIAEIETDKATMEVEAVDEGMMGKILVSEGSEGVAVNSVIALIIEAEEDRSELNNYKTKQSFNGANSEEGKISTIESSTTAPTPAHKEASEVSAINSLHNTSKIFASPLAKRIASQNNINLANLKGSGPHQRIVKNDVLQALSSGIDSNSPNIISSNNAYDLLPVSNMRKVIAKRLLESKQTVPHFYLNIECNLDKLLNYRSQMNEILDKESKISVNDFIIKAAATSLVKVPEANSSWSNDGILQYKDIDISIAVAIDGGLVTPIIKSANFKSLSSISLEMKELASKARAGKLKPEASQGGGFSVSNLGIFVIKQFSAIINPPQGCILAIGAGIKKPVVINDQIQISTTSEMTLSVDHRVIDGAVGARFLSYLKEYIENPIKMLI